MRLVGRVWFVILLALASTSAAWARPRPETGETGASATALLERMEAAVRLADWARTGAVSWRFPGGREHLWDRDRGLARFRKGRKGRIEVLQPTDGSREGRVFRRGEEVTGPRRERLLDKAWKAFINDSFWLQPLASLRDEGVTLSIVDWNGEEGLFVEYASGGVTPGDAYLWFLGDQGRPTMWRMWVQVVPFGGLKASWEGWQQLPTGAWISTTHRLGPLRMKLRGVMAAPTLGELSPGDDPFAAFFAPFSATNPSR